MTAIVNGAALGGHDGYPAPQSLVRLLKHSNKVKKPRLTRQAMVASAVLVVATFFCCASSIGRLFAADAAGDVRFMGFLLGCGSAVIFVLQSMLISEHQKVLELRQNTHRSNMEIEHNLWEQLYYCHQHDVVFLPGLDAAVPPQHMHEFLREGREAIQAIEAREAASPPVPDIIETRQMDGGYML